MTKQNLTQQELAAMVAAMELAEWGEEIEVEIIDEDYDAIGDNELYAGQSGLPLGEDFHCEDDGQPSEYDEWQDYYGGDDSIYEHDCDCMFDN
jgi:succinate dehydrogenase/fumarate reductase flavoprotein subunit